MAEAVLTFNNENIAQTSVLSHLGCTLSSNAIKGMKTIDRARIYKAEKAVLAMTKEARMKKRQIRRKWEDEESQKNHQDYGPGLF